MLTEKWPLSTKMEQNQADKDVLWQFESDFCTDTQTWISWERPLCFKIISSFRSTANYNSNSDSTVQKSDSNLHKNTPISTQRWHILVPFCGFIVEFLSFSGKRKENFFVGYTGNGRERDIFLKFFFIYFVVCSFWRCLVWSVGRNGTRGGTWSGHTRVREETSHCILASPLTRQFCVLFAICLIDTCDFRHEWIVWVWVCEKGTNRQ